MAGDSEVITFSGSRNQKADILPPWGSASSLPVPRAVIEGELQDSVQYWATDRWKDYFLFINGTPISMDVVITGNTASQIFGSIPATSAWSYFVYRYMANTYKHFKTITSITTTNMNVTYLTVSVPHYFDTENALGTVYSFAPHTDGIDDGYVKDTSIGQWTLNVEAAMAATLDNFLNVFMLKDPEDSKPDTALLQGTGVTGALVGTFFAIFKNASGTVLDTSVTFPSAGTFSGLFLNLEPSTDYWYKVTGTTVDLNNTDNGGTPAVSTSMGTLKITVVLT